MMLDLRTSTELIELLPYLSAHDKRELDGLLRIPERPPLPTFRAASLAIQTATQDEIAIEGPAGTGKSFAALYKLHTIAQTYPHARLLIVRATRESLTESALVTFERDVLGTLNPICQGAQRANRHSYLYPDTRAEIVIAGLKQSGKDMRAKVLSTEYDVIYAQEVNEIHEDDYEKLTTRLRNGKVPYQQIISDLNPDAPSHWIYQREESGCLKMFISVHKDNPALWTGTQWTKEGQAYLDKLSHLTGVQKLRYFEGKRAMAEGLVYGDVWVDGASDGNVTEKAEYELGNGEVVWFVDDGYAGEMNERGFFTPQSHPRVFLFAQLRPNGIICVFDESYRIKVLEEQHVDEVLKRPYPKPTWSAVDKSAAQLRGRIHAKGIYTRGSPSEVKASINVLRSFIAPDENQVRKFLVHPRCKHFRREMNSYRYEPNSEIPVKEDDHGPDAARYGVWALRHNQ